MRTFKLIRLEDPSGVSGTGEVAEGVEFANGQVALEWLSEHPSIEIWPWVGDLISIHGHGGKTQVVWDEGNS